MEIGTMNQQLRAIEDYLSIPADVRRDYGQDEIWQYVHSRTMVGKRTEMVDQDFRDCVRKMRAV